MEKAVSVLLCLFAIALIIGCTDNPEGGRKIIVCNDICTVISEPELVQDGFDMKGVILQTAQGEKILGFYPSSINIKSGDRVERAVIQYQSRLQDNIDRVSLVRPLDPPLPAEKK